MFTDLRKYSNLFIVLAVVLFLGAFLLFSLLSERGFWAMNWIYTLMISLYIFAVPAICVILAVMLRKTADDVDGLVFGEMRKFNETRADAEKPHKN